MSDSTGWMGSVFLRVYGCLRLCYEGNGLEKTYGAAYTQESIAMLLERRTLRSNMLRLVSSELTFMKGNNLQPAKGLVLDNVGQRLMKIRDFEDGSIHHRYYDQVTFNAAPSQEGAEEEVARAEDDEDGRRASRQATVM